MSRETYWITVELRADSDLHAEQIARQIELDPRRTEERRVIDVQPKPPQGSTIVGDMHEDEIGT